MPPLSEQQNEAKALLDQLFSILNKMVTDTMNSQQQSNSESCRPLSEIQGDLNKLEFCFTDEKCPILNEVAKHLDDYKAKIKELLANKPQASDALNSDELYDEIMNQPD